MFPTKMLFMVILPIFPQDSAKTAFEPVLVPGLIAPFVGEIPRTTTLCEAPNRLKSEEGVTQTALYREFRQSNFTPPYDITG